MILEDFAGPGGWSEGARMAGYTGPAAGIEWDQAACETAVAAGHLRIRADVAGYPSAPFSGVDGYIGSPPCQGWSMAGRRRGEADRAACHELAGRMASGRDWVSWREWSDKRSPLVCEPVRRVRELRPRWIALEQVPAVLGLWQHFAGIFREWGYSAWTGILSAERYGVPQTRRRAILIARRDGIPAAPPAATHSAYPGEPEPDLFADPLPRWVSMADALGWGMTARPSVAVMAGGSRTGAPAPLDGGSGARAALRRAQAAGTWIRMGNQDGASVRHINEPARDADEPAPTMLFGTHGNAGVDWIQDRPATTDPASVQDSVRVTVAEAGVLQSFPAGYPWQGSRTKRFEQVGNAVPPLLAAAILALLLAVTL